MTRKEILEETARELSEEWHRINDKPKSVHKAMRYIKAQKKRLRRQAMSRKNKSIKEILP